MEESTAKCEAISTASSSTSSTNDPSFAPGRETDKQKIENRMKQIHYGKNTVGYDHYVSSVPKKKREWRPEHPRTPDVYEEMSKRDFDGRVKSWRRSLHLWDNLDSRPDGLPVINKRLNQSNPFVQFSANEDYENSIIDKKRKISSDQDDCKSTKKASRIKVVDDNSRMQPPSQVTPPRSPSLHIGEDLDDAYKSGNDTEEEDVL